MSKMFGNQSTENHEAVTDRIGGGAVVLPTDAYEAIVKLAYVTNASASQAQCVNLVLEINGKEIQARQWVTNKEGKNFYPDKQDSKKTHVLPGYNMIDDLCLVTTGLPLNEQEFENKVVGVYNFDERKEVPTNVPVLTAVMGEKVIVCLEERKVNKQKKVGDAYVDTAETRNENEIVKFIHAESKSTVVEAREGLEPGTYLEQWTARFKGKVNDRSSTSSNAGSEGRPGAARPAAAAGGTAQPKTSLFGKK